MEPLSLHPDVVLRTHVLMRPIAGGLADWRLHDSNLFKSSRRRQEALDLGAARTQFAVKTRYAGTKYVPDGTWRFGD